MSLQVKSHRFFFLDEYIIVKGSRRNDHVFHGISLVGLNEVLVFV